MMKSRLKLSAYEGCHCVRCGTAVLWLPSEKSFKLSARAPTVCVIVDEERNDFLFFFLF